MAIHEVLPRQTLFNRFQLIRVVPMISTSQDRYLWAAPPYILEDESLWTSRFTDDAQCILSAKASHRLLYH